MFLLTHQEALYLKEIFQNVHSKFFDTLDHLWNHPEVVEDSEAIAVQVPTSQNCSKEVFFLELVK